jgi:molybdopterin/thiamine biosynthesis adenylyltransferase
MLRLRFAFLFAFFAFLAAKTYLPSMTDTPDRYSRQIRFAPFGKDGQERLRTARVLIVGCGALGTVSANLLVRAGVGHVRIVDRDFVELTNLQRQVLFDEDDLAAELPKAMAAANKLRRVNSTIEIEPIVADVNAGNITALCAEVDCIVDGTDNFETRFLVNDAAHSLNIPWVYGGCLGDEGQVMTFLPGETPCLRCVMSEPPPAGSSATCDTAGVLGPAASLVGAWQANEALKILSGNRAAVNRQWMLVDLWNNTTRGIKLDRAAMCAECGCCTRGDYPWLRGERGSLAAVLCGRNAVQLNGIGGERSLDELRKLFAGRGELSGNAYLLRWKIAGYTLTFFPDSRVVIHGTDDIAKARAVFAEYVGM